LHQQRGRRDRTKAYLTRDAPGNATPVWDCAGFSDDDSADFFVRIRQTRDKCAAYSWSYSF
jgi:hypothetical protein